jgi:hypothetical protein
MELEALSPPLHEAGEILNRDAWRAWTYAFPIGRAGPIAGMWNDQRADVVGHAVDIPDLAARAELQASLEERGCASSMCREMQAPKHAHRLRRRARAHDALPLPLRLSFDNVFRPRVLRKPAAQGATQLALSTWGVISVTTQSFPTTPAGLKASIE